MVPLFLYQLHNHCRPTTLPSRFNTVRLRLLHGSATCFDLSYTCLLNHISRTCLSCGIMGLYTKLPDAIDEVDVIIAGGQYSACRIQRYDLLKILVFH